MAQAGTDREVIEGTAVEGDTDGSGMRISEHPEDFGNLAELLKQINEGRHRDLINQLVTVLFVLALIPLAIIAWRASLEMGGTGNGKALIDAVKILFIAGLLVIVAFQVALAFGYAKIRRTLWEMEELAFLGRDFARFKLPYYRQEIRELNEKLTGKGEEALPVSGLDIARNLMPVVSLVLNKEKNLLKWGMSGLKMYKTVKSFFSDNKNDK